MRYLISAAAAADIQHVAREGLQRFGAGQAAVYVDGLNRAFKLIAAFPLSNRERPELSPPQRVCRYGAHLVFYTTREDAVLILRVRHGREDWAGD